MPKPLTLLTLTALLSGAHAQTTVTSTVSPVTPSQVSTVRLTQQVPLTESQELKKTVSVQVPAFGLSLDAALTLVGRSAGLTVLTQNLPPVTLRASLTKITAREAVETLLRLYAPTHSAYQKGQLLLIAESDTIRRFMGAVPTDVRSDLTEVVRVPGLTEENLASVRPLLRVTAQYWQPGVAILYGSDASIARAKELLSQLPAPPAPPVQAAPAAPVKEEPVLRTYTVAGDAVSTARGLSELLGSGATVTVRGQTLLVRALPAAQEEVLTFLKIPLPEVAPAAGVAPTSAPVRRSYATDHVQADAAYLSAMYPSLRLVPLTEQKLIVVEGTEDAQQTVAAALKLRSDARAALSTVYYPITRGKAATLADALRREAPGAVVTVIEERNLLGVQTTAAEHVRLTTLLQTLQAAPTMSTESDSDVITRSVALSYAEAAMLTNDLTAIAAGTDRLKADSAAGKLGDVTIIADKRTNALLLTGPRRQVAEIVSAVNLMDVPARSVRLRLRIDQMSVADARALGVNWQVGIAGVNFGQQDGRIQAGFTPGLAPLSFDVELNAARSNGKGRTVIDTNFAALSGQETVFQNGGELLFPAQSGTGNNSQVIPALTYSYGLEIAIKPRIAPDGTVVATLETNVGTAPTPGPGNSVNQQKQKFSSAVQLKPGEQIVLGGVVTETTDNSQKGVPGLSRIPVIGALFGTTTDSDSRVALVFTLSAEALKTERIGTDRQEIGAPASTEKPAQQSPAIQAVQASPAATAPGPAVVSAAAPASAENSVSASPAVPPVAQAVSTGGAVPASEGTNATTNATTTTEASPAVNAPVSAQPSAPAGTTGGQAASDQNKTGTQRVTIPGGK